MKFISKNTNLFVRYSCEKWNFKSNMGFYNPCNSIDKPNMSGPLGPSPY